MKRVLCTLLLLLSIPFSLVAKSISRSIKTVKRTQNKISSTGIGIASWYGKLHQGKKMANGKPFDRFKLTCASWLYPLGTNLVVTNLSNGQSVVVEVTDRGPAVRGRIIDLSEKAAKTIDCMRFGLCKVLIYPTSDNIYVGE